MLSVIIASCNREALAFATAQSLLDAGIGRVVIVDDASSTPYECRTSEERLTLLRISENSGPSAARNHGARAVEAEWIIFLDDDDSLQPCLIDWVQAHASTSLKYFDLVHFGFRSIDQENQTSSEIIISTSGKPTVLSGSWMMRREFFQKLGGYEERLRYSENSDLMDRASLAGAKTYHADFHSLIYTTGRPRRAEEMAVRRAEACIFYLMNRPQCDRIRMLKIGIANSLNGKKIDLLIKTILVFILSIKFTLFRAPN